MDIRVIERNTGDRITADVSLNGKVYQTDVEYTPSFISQLRPKITRDMLEDIVIDEVMRYLKKEVEYIPV